jgi:hypothetical protein
MAYWPTSHLHLPVDVYEKGALLDGYVYDNIDACLADLTAVIQIHLS